MELPEVAVGILAAMQAEVDAVKGRMVDKADYSIRGLSFTTGLIEDNRCVVVRTGAGKVNAAMTTTLLIEHFEPQLIICTGIAGGLNPHLSRGDIIIAEKVAHHDYGELTPEGFESWETWNPIRGEANPLFIVMDSELLSLAEQVSKSFDTPKISGGENIRVPKVGRGVIITGDTFCTALNKRLELERRFEADAVDMEGASVAQVCWQMGISTLLIRSISDVDEEIDQDWDRWLKIASNNAATLVAAIVGKIQY
jgi:adenosylhomocysteine nucleosidase